MRRLRERWLVAALVLMTGAYAVAEDVGLVTSYPSPRGVFAGLRIRGSAPVTSVPRAVISTPGTQASNRSDLVLFTQDPNLNGRRDGVDRAWYFDAPGDQFGTATMRNDLVLYKLNVGDVFTIPMEIDFASGNIGLATGVNPMADPTQRLTLFDGNILLPNENVGTDGNFYFGGVTDLGQVGMRLFGGILNGGPAGGGYIDVKSTDPNNGLQIRVDTVNGGTRRMMVAANGNIGIGPSIPTNTLDVDGSIEIGDHIETSHPNNRFRFCGSALGVSTDPASCSEASELIASRIRLSADGSFANAEAQTDPGWGGVTAPGNVIVGGKLGVMPPVFDPDSGTLKSYIPGTTGQFDGNTRVNGKLQVNGPVDAGTSISVTGNVTGEWVGGLRGICVRGSCKFDWNQPPTVCPPPGADHCRWRYGPACGRDKSVSCQAGEYAHRVQIYTSGGCGDVKEDFGVGLHCCTLQQ